MTQEYLNQLFENYTGVSHYYWTADGTAFTNIDNAMKHAERLEDGTVKCVAHGGDLKDAETIVDGTEQHIPSTEGDAEKQGALVLTELSHKQLQDLCKHRNVVYKANASKATLIELLEAQMKIDLGDAEKTDYTAMTLEALQDLCKEREIELNGEDAAEKIIELLTKYDEAHAVKE